MTNKALSANITDLLALAIRCEKTKSVKVRQTVKMKAGKVKKVLREANDESKKRKSGIKLEN
jgi:hypothetical protein